MICMLCFGDDLARDDPVELSPSEQKRGLGCAIDPLITAKQAACLLGYARHLVRDIRIGSKLRR